MNADLLATVAPLYVIAGLGFAWARFGRAYDRGVISDLTLNVGAPCLVFSSLTSLDVGSGAAAEMAVGALISLALFTLIGAAVLRIAGLPFRTFLPPLVFPNTGNMGLAVSLFAFGDEGLAYGVVFFVIVTILHYTLGLWVWSGEAMLGTTVRTPLIWATAAAVIVLVAGLPVPEWVERTTSTLGGIAIPLMQFTLGVSIASLALDRLPRAVFISVLRLAMGLGVGVAVAAALGLEGVARGVLILDCAMPVAVVNSMFAERYGRSPSEVASTVVISTLISFVTLPLLLAWLMR